MAQARRKDSGKALAPKLRRELERLRDDCRRHARPVVVLVETIQTHAGKEKPSPVELRAADGEHRAHARAQLERLGSVLEAEPALWCRLGLEAPEPSKWMRARRLAERALLSRAAWRIESESRCVLVRDALGEAEETALLASIPPAVTTKSRRVPDVLAEVAAIADELLVDPSASKQADADEFNEPTGNHAKAIWELDALEPGALLKTAVLAVRLRIGPRRAARVLGELKEEGWRIVSVSGPRGGARLGDSQSEKQREWLEHTRP